MKTSFALLSVTLALSTAVEGSPLNFAALLKRNNDKAHAEATPKGCVQVTSKQAGKCVTPAAGERVAEGTSITLVDCKDASTWQLPEGGSGPISLCDDSSLVLDAGRDVQDGGRLSLYNANGTPQQDFKVNDDGTISVGKDQCLDAGRDGSLQTWTCDASNGNQQFTATPIERGNEHNDGKAPAQDHGPVDHHKDTQQEEKEELEKQTITKTEVRTDAHTDVKTATFNHTDIKTAFVTDIKTVTKDETEIRTQTKEVPTTIKETITKTQERTDTETKPVTVYKTETKVEQAAPVTQTQSVTITPKPITETQKITETPKPITETKKVTITETQKITETPKAVTETISAKPVTKTETKYETKYDTKYETKYDTRYETKYETKYEQARPTDYGKQDDVKNYEGGQHH